MRMPFFGSVEERPAAAQALAIPPGETVVLIVEDEPAQRHLFALALRREGYCVLEAQNGAEALDVAASAGRVDLVISDVVMPVLTGPKMAAQLRDRFPEVQFLFVSGYLMSDDLGPNAHVMQKPFVRRDLLKHVYDLVGPPTPEPAIA
jgi:two-component system, cell cycle sensor histidine kinase and response regulator CckA